MSKRCSFSTQMASSAGLFSVSSASFIKRLFEEACFSWNDPEMHYSSKGPRICHLECIQRDFLRLLHSHLRLKKGFHESVPRGGFTSNVRRVKVRLLKEIKAAGATVSPPYGWMNDHISWNYLHHSLWAKFRGPLRTFIHRISMKLNIHIWVMTQGMTQELGLRFRNVFNLLLLTVKNYLVLCGFTQSYHVASKKLNIMHNTFSPNFF